MSQITNFSTISFSTVLFYKNMYTRRRISEDIIFSAYHSMQRVQALQLSANSLIARLNSPAMPHRRFGRDNALIIAQWYFAASSRVRFRKGCPMKSAIQPNYGPWATIFALLFRLPLSFILVTLYLVLSHSSEFATIFCASIFIVYM